MNKEQTQTLARILTAGGLLIVVKLLKVEGLAALAWYAVPYAIIGWDVLWRAVRNIFHGEVFDENFLMSLATVGAFVTAQYAEAVFVMLFYQVGELFQDVAVDRSRKSIADLMNLRPDSASVERGEAVESVDPETVAVGEILVVKPGERIALDGVVLTGSSALDTAALTGESAPRDVGPGDGVLSGCVNQTGLLRITVSKVFGESTVSKILDLVENSSEKKAKSESFITRFARIYTPCVVLAAAALFALPALALALIAPGNLPGFLAGTDWTEWLHRALIFLVISCPCALVISVPLSFFGGIGGASKCGILVKGSNFLEALAQTETVIFDKTGTLTQGRFAVTQLCPEPNFSPELLLEYAALAESWSDHPISLSLKAACKTPLDPRRVTEVEELAGHGVRAQIDGKKIAVGNRRMMEGLAFSPCALPGTPVYVAVDGRFAGCLVLGDQVKPDAAAAIAQLKACGVQRTVMLTGDTEAVAAAVATALGVDEYHAGLLPADKVAWTEKLLAETKGKLAFVGDGINDAPVLTRADIGIAMGALGSDAAIEAADIVLMDDRPSKIATAMGISRKTLRIVKQNIYFALGVKALVLVLGAFGLASMWAAVFADVGVSFLAILNATRALRVKEFKSPV